MPTPATTPRSKWRSQIYRAIRRCGRDSVQRGRNVPAQASSMTPTPTTGDKSISNPYASVAMPTYSGCSSTNYNPNTNQTLAPVGGVYVFCGNVNIGGSNKVTLNTGTYIVNGGSFSVSGSATLTSAGTDVTLCLLRAPRRISAARSI